MCGIGGMISPRRIDPAVVGAMAASLAHRGPDDTGTWIDEAAGIGLAHRRLSIVDLSPSGHQPMHSESGRFVLSFNGEIYNHAEIRAELEAIAPRTWRGHSDTETLLAAIDQWGLEAAIERSVGMFALALWDRKSRLLQLVRDRFGEKPLYYGWVGGDFLFGSELKALRVHPRFDNPVSRTALRLFASRIYIPAPLSIYEHVYKLEPGCILTVTPEAAASRPSGPPTDERSANGLKLHRYWSYREVVARGIEQPIEDEGEALRELERALSTAISGQSVADVPVGAFLSGGIDSSTVVGLYQRLSSRPIRTFTIGFEEEGYDEAGYARDVARHFGTEHHEHYVTSREAQQVLPLLPGMYDEPFADPSQVPTHLVSRFAREQVTVALSGDGGDELFGGYNRYFTTARVWGHMRRMPRPLRSAIGHGLGRVPPRVWNRVGSLLPSGRQPPYFGAKVQKAFRIMGAAQGLEGAFHAFTDEWYAQPSPVLGDDGSPDAYPFDLDAGRGAPDAVRMMYCDAVSYLPDDILCKVDRAAMAVSLETRIPFLDHRVADVAARIPIGMKIGGGKGKLILRKLLHGMAPPELFDRPKAGFGFPVGKWITGALRPWAESLLDENRLRTEGYFDASLVRGRWQELLNGERDAGFSIWTILMFQAWLDAFERAESSDEPRRLAS